MFTGELVNRDCGSRCWVSVVCVYASLESSKKSKRPAIPRPNERPVNTSSAE